MLNFLVVRLSELTTSAVVSRTKEAAIPPRLSSDALSCAVCRTLKLNCPQITGAERVTGCCVGVGLRFFQHLTLLSVISAAKTHTHTNKSLESFCTAQPVLERHTFCNSPNPHLSSSSITTSSPFIRSRRIPSKALHRRIASVS